MKLLCLIPSLGTGGAERQMVYLIQFLNEHQIVPDVLTYYDSNNDYDLSAIEINRYEVLTKNKIGKLWNIIHKIHRLKPDVILSFCSLPNYIACVYGYLHPKCKIVVSERGSRRFEGYAKFLYRRVSAIVANSNCQTQELKSIFPRFHNRIFTISNYTDISRFDAPNRPREERLRIGILARYNPSKNLKRFIEAVHIVNTTAPHLKIDYAWYGNKHFKDGQPTDNSAYYMECEELRKKLNIDNLALNDFIKDSCRLYNEVDVICLPSLSEGFSNTLSEALCAGKPILASVGSGDNETFVDDGMNGFLFDPNDVDAIAASIVRIAQLSNVDFLSFQKWSRRKAEKRFNKEHFVVNWLNVLMGE